MCSSICRRPRSIFVWATANNGRVCSPCRPSFYGFNNNLNPSGRTQKRVVLLSSLFVRFFPQKLCVHNGPAPGCSGPSPPPPPLISFLFFFPFSYSPFYFACKHNPRFRHPPSRTLLLLSSLLPSLNTASSRILRSRRQCRQIGNDLDNCRLLNRQRSSESTSGARPRKFRTRGKGFVRSYVTPSQVAKNRRRPVIVVGDSLGKRSEGFF